MKHLFLILFFGLVTNLDQPLMGSVLSALQEAPMPAVSSSSTSQPSKTDLIKAIAQSTGNAEEFMELHAPDFKSLSQDDLHDLFDNESFKGALDQSTEEGASYYIMKGIVAHKKKGTVFDIRGRYKLLPSLWKYSETTELGILYSWHLKVLPRWIGDFKKLTHLDLTGNNFTLLPPELAQLKSLQTLYLKDNRLVTVPDVVGKLRSLTFLSLSCNRLKELPDWIGDLTQLQIIYLGFNLYLEGLPLSFAKLTNLETLGYDDVFLKKEGFKGPLGKLIEAQRASKKKVVNIWDILDRDDGALFIKEYPLDLFATPTANNPPEN